jgi:hypothetical protein
LQRKLVTSGLRALLPTPVGISSTGATPPIVLLEQDSPTIRKEDTDEVKDVIRDIHAAITPIPGEHTKATYLLVDEVENISAPAEGKAFKLSDAKQLELFYRSRLTVIPMKLLRRISGLWYKKLASRDLSNIDGMTVSRLNIYDEGKDGEYHGDYHLY